MNTVRRITASLFWWFQDATGRGHTIRDPEYFMRVAVGGFVLGTVLGLILPTQMAGVVASGLYLAGIAAHFFNYGNGRDVGFDVETWFWCTIPSLVLSVALVWRFE